ncbi:MAG: hypothetical protein RR232_05080 [Clostridia bacterium]
MKKLLVLITVIAMILSLVACAANPAPDADAQPPVDATQADDQEALAAADFEQVKTFLAAVQAHHALAVPVATIREQVISGEADASELLDGLKMLSDDSQALLANVQAAEWKTEDCSEHVALLNELADSLAQAELLCYEAAGENDEAKLESSSAFLRTYEEKLSALLDLMGV